MGRYSAFQNIDSADTCIMPATGKNLELNSKGSKIGMPTMRATSKGVIMMSDTSVCEFTSRHNSTRCALMADRRGK